jgi:hypothetical protein
MSNANSTQAKSGGTQGAGGGRIRPTSNVLLSATFFIIFTGAVVIAWTSYPEEAAAMPLMIGGTGAVLSLLQFVLDLRASRGDYKEKVNLKKDLPIYLWVWAFVIAITAFGFMIAAPVMLFIYLKFRSRESWVLTISLTVLVIAVLYGFETFLGVDVFQGLITPSIQDWLFPSS